MKVEHSDNSFQERRGNLPLATSGPLEGIRVLDLARWIAGPLSALILGDLGADVVKVESGTKGDDSRTTVPKVNGESLYFVVMNRNKRGVALNFRHPEGLDLLRKLAAKSDVLIENFRPGTMEAMGCSYSVLREINPRLIVASISGFGQDGPLARRPCFDSIAQAMSGFQMMNGFPDRPPIAASGFVADMSSALYATIGILAALQYREKTGHGQHVDVSLLDSLMSLLVTSIPEYVLLGTYQQRQGTRARYSVPAGTFRARDGYIQLSAGTDAIFSRLVKAMGREDALSDPRFATFDARNDNVDAVEAFVEEWTTQHPVDELEALLENAEVPCSKVCSVADLFKNPQVQHRRGIIEIDHPRVGKVPVHNVTTRLSASPGSIRRAAPLLGQHNEEILSEWLGMSQPEIEDLRQRGVVCD